VPDLLDLAMSLSLMATFSSFAVICWIVLAAGVDWLQGATSTATITRYRPWLVDWAIAFVLSGCAAIISVAAHLLRLERYLQRARRLARLRTAGSTKPTATSCPPE